jgi:hypothetical protein
MTRARALLFGIMLSAACAQEGGRTDPCADGKCDATEDRLDDRDVPASACDGVVIDRSGRTNSDGTPIARVVGRLDDPLANLVYKTPGGCPITADAIMNKLATTDATSCLTGSGAIGGLQTRVVSEQAQLTGQAAGAGYRTVTTRMCGDREPFELMFSLFGFGSQQHPVTASTVPGEVEIMAFDRTAGVFNYYKEVGGKLQFFGTSNDFVALGPDGPSLTDVRGCANCHTGGGPIMKELLVPWLHWEGTFSTPGAQELVMSRQAFMGGKADGVDMELAVVRPATERWNETRVARARERGDVAALLRPLFCPVEVNITNPNALGIIGGTGVRIPSDFFLDVDLGSFAGGSLLIPSQHYAALARAISQVVPGTNTSDHLARFGLIHRSFADSDYVRQLVTTGVVDEAFVKDVLMIDFTRPVFSDDRCDLLRFAPDAIDASAPAASVRRGFLAELRGAAMPGTPAAQLLAHLEATEAGTSLDHETRIRAFETSCRDRAKGATIRVKAGAQMVDVTAFAADLMKLKSLHRKIAFTDGVLDELTGSAAHPFAVFEFDDTMTTDAVVPTEQAQPGDLLRIHPAARLSPIDCALVSRFVPVP